MPSPVAHTLFGLTIYTAWCRNIRNWLKQWKIILWVIFCSNLLDFDLFIGLIKGNMGLYHQGYSHTLGVILIITLVVYVVLKLVKNQSAVNITFLTFLVLFSHLLLDMFNMDSNPPIGIMAFWPFYSGYINFYQLFKPVPHLSFSDIFDPMFIEAVCSDMLVSVLLLIVILFKLRLADNGKE